MFDHGNMSSRIKFAVVLVASVFGIMILPHAFSETMQSSDAKYNETQFDLKINETYSVSDALKIKLLNVTSDSRCPETANCIWQGQVTALVGVTQKGQDLGNFSLSTMAGHVFENYDLSILQVNPSKSIDKQIAPSDYTITFAISDANTGVSIENVFAQPSAIKVGDTFTVNATLVNHSLGTITVHNDCISPFSATFDSHATVEVIKPCIYFAKSRQVNPGENITVTGPGSNIDYRAVSPGTANGTITFSYTVENQTGSGTSSASNPVSVSKSFLFTILENSQMNDTHSHPVPMLASPLMQFKSGISASDVKCQQGFGLVIKSDDNSPACVKPDTAAKLVAWGWAKLLA